MMRIPGDSVTIDAKDKHRGEAVAMAGIRFLHVAMRAVGWAWSKVPFIGGFPDTSTRDHLEACREVTISQIISTAPIWGGAVAVAWPDVNDGFFGTGLSEMVKNGELFIYASSTLAPLVYIATRDRDTPRSFPNKFWYISAVVIGTILAAIVFTLQRLKTGPIAAGTISLSWWLYAISVALLYCALVYHNTYIPNAAAVMRKEEDDYARKVGQRH